MKILSRGHSLTLGLALIAAGLAAPPMMNTATAAPKPDPTAVEKIRRAADGTVALRTNPATGKAGFVRAKSADGDLLPSVVADNEAEAEAKAEQYVERFAAPAFGVEADQLDQTEVFTDRYGSSVTFTQSHDGVPVFGAELKAHVDRSGRLTSVNGFVAPDAEVDTTPSFTQEEAERRALTMVKEEPAGREDGLTAADAKGLEIASNELMIYRTGSTRGADGEAKLAWVLEVTNEDTVRETVIIDARTGKHLNRWSMITHALERHLYEGHDNGTPDDLSDDTYTNEWNEGDPFPDDLTEDQQNEVLGTGEAYWLFMNTFGYDSYDGEGAPMITVNNDPSINCPNANWNGFTTNYCTGVTGDDTVAHEWAHAYTEYTSGLIYQWQAGAMNEAYSDIWGEAVDMLNDRHNEGGETEADPVLRTPGLCSDYTRSPITMEITAPEEIAGPCDAAPAAFGPVIGQTPITADVVVAEDEANDQGPSTTDGCTAYTNEAAVEGNWAYVDRGVCTFATKAQNAEAAGALGIVIGNNVPGAPFSASGSAEIYGVMVDQATGTDIKSVDGPVSIEVAAVPNETDDTYRWLSGESDPAFGGAIRDMWNPNCYGDPGKVSDAEYHCTEDDAGGVHTNSGVVNRAFAILVDGLPDAGVTAIGLDKAANLFWQAQTKYLTPVSNFPDLADALEASCADLTGQPINRLTLGNPTDPDGSDGAATPEVADPITASDCASVTAAIAETELRKEPAQCNFVPMLDKGQVTCGEGFDSVTTWSEDFEDGLAGWTQDHEFFVLAGDPEGEYQGGHVQHPWVTTDELPETTDLPGDAGTHEPSNVAFAVDPTTGSCQLDEDDESARNGLISPEIAVPDGAFPRFSFDHLMASEALWDGGNVKVSVNGGDFELVPERAWMFNRPGGQLETLAEGNTNPMAGEPAFTGTDGGQLSGSWGTSVISLERVGAGAGDTVQFRFDFGRDGCNGFDGWYVDDVRVTICEEADEPPAKAATKTKVVSVKPKTVKRNKPFFVKVKVNSADTPKGKVQVRKGKRVLARGTLNKKGVVTIKVAKGRLAVGRHQLVAVYLGNASFKASRDAFRVRVVRR